MTGITTPIIVDEEAEAAYIYLTDETTLVDRTVFFTEDILVDVDSDGIPIGVELLTLDTPIPTDELTDHFTLSPEALESLKGLREHQKQLRPHTA